MNSRKIPYKGFTIVELLVVIAVIGILAAVGIVGYGAWQKRVQEGAVKADLMTAAAAMENAKNFSTGYPYSIPSTFKASISTIVTGGGIDSQTFCIQASSKKDSSILMYVTNTVQTPTYGNCNASTSLAGWWPMNGNASDASGNGNNGTVNGATLTTGQNGNANSAYSFNGTTAYIDGGTNTSLTFADNFTLSAWIKPTSYHTTGYYGLKNGIFARGPATTFNYVLQATDATTISFVKRTGTEGLQFYNFTSIPSLTNKWTLVTFTVKSGTATLYVDGALFGTNTVSTIAGVVNDRLYIGSAAAATVEALFIGSIDEAKIYGRALSAGEIQALYSAGAQ
jgi:prepilin-type N-terminal cleavage/methylation domain-containing protein